MLSAFKTHVKINSNYLGSYRLSLNSLNYHLFLSFLRTLSPTHLQELPVKFSQTFSLLSLGYYIKEPYCHQDILKPNSNQVSSIHCVEFIINTISCSNWCIQSTNFPSQTGPLINIDALTESRPTKQCLKKSTSNLFMHQIICNGNKEKFFTFFLFLLEEPHLSTASKRVLKKNYNKAKKSYLSIGSARRCPCVSCRSRRQVKLCIQIRLFIWLEVGRNSIHFRLISHVCFQGI